MHNRLATDPGLYKLVGQIRRPPDKLMNSIAYQSYRHRRFVNTKDGMKHIGEYIVMMESEFQTIQDFVQWLELALGHRRRGTTDMSTLRPLPSSSAETDRISISLTPKDSDNNVKPHFTIGRNTEVGLSSRLVDSLTIETVNRTQQRGIRVTVGDGSDSIWANGTSIEHEQHAFAIFA
ncbi:hypothetical protein CPB84DRAFT_1751797 [Gymnopilus junonius]|uniref:Uncharacterized protein n=1 Tax=Gymnopilus junonius TaxID=109634 RepID=A0A9P5NDD5_GYMJU|nr:hypothetical protein CPB84DRAFT_1751797 [Gymnopilus junonius]